MITNTENQDPLARIMLMMGGQGPAIEQQEAQGQQQLAASSQLPAKNNGREDIMAFYQGCGIKVIGPSKNDGMFLDVQLPEGWKIKPTDHSMWSDLVDANGRKRAGIFYKAAFYDRSAFINMERRYYARWESNPEDKGLCRYVVVDTKTGATLAEDIWSNYEGTSGSYAKWGEWLDQHFPNHKDPLAYWND